MTHDILYLSQDQMYEEEMLLERQGKREIKMEDDLIENPPNSEAPVTTSTSKEERPKSRVKEGGNQGKEPTREKGNQEQQQAKRDEGKPKGGGKESSPPEGPSSKKDKGREEKKEKDDRQKGTRRVISFPRSYFIFPITPPPSPPAC